MRVLRILAALMALAPVLVGCSAGDAGGQSAVPERVDRIFLTEGGEYVPFLMVDERDDLVLLLREHVKCSIPFSAEGAESCYYGDSALDAYLNGEYLSALAPQVQEMIVTMPVEITARESIGRCGERTEEILRKVFILSRMEATGVYGGTSLKEGEPIAAMKAHSLLAATDDAGGKAAWWLRTPDTWYWYTLSTIATDGATSTRVTEDSYGRHSLGVRPAFYMKKEAIAAGQGDGWYVSKNQ